MASAPGLSALVYRILYAKQVGKVGYLPLICSYMFKRLHRIGILYKKCKGCVRHKSFIRTIVIDGGVACIVKDVGNPTTK